MPPAPATFAIECACGTWARGDRQPKPQVVTCAGCGKPVFVFPAAASVFGAAIPSPRPEWSTRLTYWLPPAAAAALALAVVGVVIAAIVRGHRPPAGTTAVADVSEYRASTLFNDRFVAARTALEEGSYHAARQELDAARDLAVRYPRAVDHERAATLNRWRRQADLLADLVAESIGEIVRHSVGRADREWDAVFRERYAGKSVVLDARVFRDAAGHIHVDYALEAAGGVGAWDLDGLKVLATLPLQQPQRLFFGFRLRAIRRLARDRWSVVPEPDSGVLLTDTDVLRGLSVALDEDLTEVLRRQAKWDVDG